jgi:hypothetical protein
VGSFYQQSFAFLAACVAAKSADHFLMICISVGDLFLFLRSVLPPAINGSNKRKDIRSDVLPFI